MKTIVTAGEDLEYHKDLHELQVVHVLSPREPLDVDVLVDVKTVER